MRVAWSMAYSRKDTVPVCCIERMDRGNDCDGNVSTQDKETIVSRSVLHECGSGYAVGWIGGCDDVLGTFEEEGVGRRRANNEAGSHKDWLCNFSECKNVAE